MQSYVFLKWIKKHTGQKGFAVLTRLFFISLIAVLLTAFIYLTYYGLTKWSGRSMTMLDPTYATRFIPIIASVSEH